MWLKIERLLGVKREISKFWYIPGGKKIFKKIFQSSGPLFSDLGGFFQMDELNQPNSSLNTKIESFYARVMKTYFFRNKNLHTYLTVSGKTIVPFFKFLVYCEIAMSVQVFLIHFSIKFMKIICMNWIRYIQYVLNNSHKHERFGLRACKLALFI